MKTPDYTARLSAALSAGSTLEAALSQLRALGATPAETIKAIHIVHAVSLAEAKALLSKSAAFAAAVEASEPLQSEVLSILAASAQSFSSVVPTAEVLVTVARMEAHLSLCQSTEVQALYRAYCELVPRFESDLAASEREVSLAKASALMLVQEFARTRNAL